MNWIAARVGDEFVLGFGCCVLGWFFGFMWGYGRGYRAEFHARNKGGV